MISVRLMCSPTTNDFCSSRFKTSMVINTCEKGDKTLIDLFEEKILKIHPNTYTVSKNLTEQIVSRDKDSLPITNLVRQVTTVIV